MEQEVIQKAVNIALEQLKHQQNPAMDLILGLGSVGILALTTIFIVLKLFGKKVNSDEKTKEKNSSDQWRDEFRKEVKQDISDLKRDLKDEINKLENLVIELIKQGKTT